MTVMSKQAESQIAYLRRCVEAREKYLSKCYWHCHRCDSPMGALSIFEASKCCFCGNNAAGTLSMSYEDGSGHAVVCTASQVGYQGVLDIAARASPPKDVVYYPVAPGESIKAGEMVRLRDDGLVVGFGYSTIREIAGCDDRITVNSHSTSSGTTTPSVKKQHTELPPPPRCEYATGKPVKHNGNPVRTITEEALSGYVRRRTREPSDWHKAAEIEKEMLGAEAAHLRRTCASMFWTYPPCSVTGESVSVEARVVDGHVAAVFVCEHCQRYTTTATFVYRVAPGESIKAGQGVRIRDDGLAVQCASDAEYNFVGFAAEDSHNGEVRVKSQ